MVFAALNALRLFRAGKLSLKKDAIGSANWQVLLAFICQVISQTMAGVEARNPSMVTGHVDPFGEKSSTIEVARNVIFVVGCCGTFVASMTIALVWLEVSERVRHMTVSTSVTQIPKIRRAVFTFELLVTVIMLGCVIAGFPNAGVVSGLVAMVIVLAAYVAGFYRLNNLIPKSSTVTSTDGRDTYRRVIREVGWTMSGVVLGIVLMLITGLIILVYESVHWKEYTPPGELAFLVVLWQLFVASLIATQIFILNALRRATNRRIHQLKTSEGTSSNHPQKASPAIVADANEDY